MTRPTLTAATLTPRSTDVVATWTVDGDMPKRGSWVLSTTLVGGEEGPIHQFGVKVLDDRLVGFFVFDHVEARQHNFPQISPQRVAAKWTAVFPTTELTIATTGIWKATLTIDGDDVDSIDGVLQDGS